jgi:Micrococcal nuclease (thermonuclease) homologs
LARSIVHSISSLLGNCLASGVILCLIFNGPASAFEARLERVVDGDSLTVRLPGGTEEVRLIGLDAPELAQEWGEEAKAFSESFCSGAALTLSFDRELRDRYGRLLAYARCDGRLLNEALLKAGLAVTLPVKPNVSLARRFKKAEKEAKAEKRGFWARGGLETSPSAFRRRHPRR